MPGSYIFADYASSNISVAELQLNKTIQGSRASILFKLYAHSWSQNDLVVAGIVTESNTLHCKAKAAQTATIQQYPDARS